MVNYSIAKQFIAAVEFPLNSELVDVFCRGDLHHRVRYILNKVYRSNMKSVAGKLQ